MPTERVLQIVSHRRDVIELEPEQDLIGVHARRGVNIYIFFFQTTFIISSNIFIYL